MDIHADLVVDCSGKGSKVPAWLRELGLEAAPEEFVRANVRYSTCTIHRRPEHLSGQLGWAVAPSPLLFFDVAAKKVVMEWPHSGMMDYPIAVDVDNDKSAEVIIVSSGTIERARGELFSSWVEKSAPTIQVLTDKDNRWIPTRRVWNMSNHHVTHVREDATVPSRQVPHYGSPNTFRTNVQMEAGGICRPIVPD